MEVIKEVFSVIKLAKIVKKTFATTFYGYGGFGGAFNENSTQLKKNWQPEVITDVFFIGALLWHKRIGGTCRGALGRSKENALVR